MSSIKAIAITVASFVLVLFALGLTAGSETPVWLFVVLWVVVAVMFAAIDSGRRGR